MYKNSVCVCREQWEDRKRQVEDVCADCKNTAYETENEVKVATEKIRTSIEGMSVDKGGIHATSPPCIQF